MRRHSQRGLVICPRRFEIAADHAGVAELGMQFGNDLDGYGAGRFLRHRGKATLERVDRFVRPAGAVIFDPDVQLACSERTGGIGVRELGGERGCWHDFRSFLRERRLQPCLILGKQNLTKAADPGLRGRGICF